MGDLIVPSVICLICVIVLAMIVLRLSRFSVAGCGHVVPCRQLLQSGQPVIVFAGGVDTDSLFFQRALDEMRELLKARGITNIGLAGLHNETQGLGRDLLEAYHQFRFLRADKTFPPTLNFAKQSRDYIVQLLEAGHPVLLIGHSQGCLTLGEILRMPLPHRDRLGVVLLSSPVHIPTVYSLNCKVTSLYNVKDPMRRFAKQDSLLCNAAESVVPQSFVHHRLLSGYFQGEPATVLCELIAEFCQSHAA